MLYLALSSLVPKSEARPCQGSATLGQRLRSRIVFLLSTLQGVTVGTSRWPAVRPGTQRRALDSHDQHSVGGSSSRERPFGALAKDDPEEWIVRRSLELDFSRRRQEPRFSSGASGRARG